MLDAMKCSVTICSPLKVSDFLSSACIADTSMAQPVMNFMKYLARPQTLLQRVLVLGHWLVLHNGKCLGEVPEYQQCGPGSAAQAEQICVWPG